MKNLIRVFLLSIILFAKFAFSQAPVLFSGTYTVGGASPNYPTVRAAVGAVSKGIVTGPVIFKIRSGTFLGKLFIPKISGTSNRNTITFVSETGNAADVIISAAGATVDTASYVVYLAGATHTIFDKVSILNSGGSAPNLFAMGFFMNLNPYKNTIRNCKIIMDTVSTSTGIYGIRAFNKFLVTFSNMKNADSTTIENNTFIGSYIGIQLEGNNFSDPHDKSNIINGNTFYLPKKGGIFTSKNDVVSVSNNTIYFRPNPPQYQSVTAIYITDSDTNTLVNGNYIKGDAETGINIANCNPLKPIIVSNNKLIIGSNATTSNSFGIRVSSSNLVHVLYNSVMFLNNKYSSEGMPAAFSYSGSSAAVGNVPSPISHFGNIVKNNIFYCPEGAWIYDCRYNTGLDIVNNNCVFTTGGKFSYWTDGYTANDFIAHKTLSNKDNLSISINPEFYSITDLKTNNELINAAGAPSINVNKDFDNELRHTSKPDIGADEFNLVIFDASLTDVYPKSLLFGENSVSVKIKNMGIRSINDSLISLSYSSDNGATWSAPEIFKPKNLNLQNNTEGYVFQQKLTISVRQTYTICVRINPGGFKSDQDPNNNSVCINPCVGFAGVYTVGGQFADFLTLKNAIDALKICGISGATTLNIQPGQYKVKLSIPEFIGSAEGNILTIQSASEKREDVTLYYDSTTYSRGIIFLEGAKFVHLNNLTLQNTSANGEYFILEIGAGASYNKVSNCDIIADTLNSGSGNSSNSIFPVIFTDNSQPQYVTIGTDAHYNVIENNLIKGGMAGIQIYGKNPSSHSVGNVIRNNKIVQSNMDGIRANNQDNIVIEGNEIILRNHSNKTEYVNGINLNNVSGFNVISNKIFQALKSGVTAMYCDTLAGPNQIVNNMIGGGFGTNAPNGIRLYSASGVKIYHNSILLDGTSTTGQVISFDYSNGLKIKNNIFYAKNSSSIYSGNSPQIVELNYNNCYYPGTTKFAVWNGVNVPSLSDFKSTINLDLNSISEIPDFKSDTNLHVTSSNFKKIAKYISAFNKDIDGEQRDPLQPFLGADEFLSINLEMLALEPKTVQTGDNQVSLTIVNKGFGTLVDSILILSFSIDDGLTWTEQSFTVKSLSGFNKTEVFVFDKNFNVPGPGDYKICGRISPPGFKLDPTRDNESICQNICVGLSGGIFTVGGDNPDFASLKAAIDYLPKGCGIGGPIVFNIRKGTYTEPLLLNKINGTSTQNTITFQAESGILGDVKIQNALNATNTLVMNGASYSIFKNLQIVNSNNKGNAVHLLNGASNNLIESCLIQVDSTNVRDSLFAVTLQNKNTIASLVNQDNTFKNCIISGGASNLYGEGAINKNFYDKGLKIEKCVLRNALYEGVKLLNNNSMSINNNSINLRITNEYAIGIFIQNSDADLSINANNIVRAGISGITIFDANLNWGILSNNMIGGQFKNSGIAYGIDLENCKKIKVIHNSINLDVETSFSAAFAGRSNKDIEVFNNIFFNKGRGYSYVIEEADASNVFDYNDHFSNGDVLASYNETIVTNLAELKTTSGQEQNSLSVNPDYLATTNLHTFKKDLDGKGKYFAVVPKDIDQTLRDALTPDIGADEFIFGDDAGVNKITSPTNNLEITEGDSVEVIVELKNFGTSNLGDFDVNLKVNTTEIKKLNYTSGLAVGSSNIFSLGYFKPSDTGTYTLCSKTFVNNDVAPSNDEKCINIKVKKKPPVAVYDGFMMSIEEPKDTLTKKYGDEKEIRVKIKNVGNVSISNFEISYTINGGAKKSETYAKTLNVNQEDVYTFTQKWTILDSGKTTICAKINVTGDNNGLNNELCKEVKVSYPIKIGIGDKAKENEFKLYPNPATEKIIIYNSQQENISYKITNVLGEVILSNILQPKENEINVENLSEGIYLVTFVPLCGKAFHPEIRDRKFIKISR